MSNTPRTVSRWIVLLTISAVLLWDLFVYTMYGGWASISAVFGWAFSWRYLGWWVIGTFGFVVGHLLGMVGHDADGYWWRVAVALVAGVVGFWLTWRMP
jgi:hypothetical protein